MSALLMAVLLVQNNSLLRGGRRRPRPRGHAEGGAGGAVRRLLAARPAGGGAADDPHAGNEGIYYRTYTTGDATIAVACVSPGMQRAFAAAIGIEDTAQADPLPDREAADRHYEPLRRQAEAILASRTTAEWKAIFDARGIPAAGVKFAIEILDDPQALANGFVHDLAHPALSGPDQAPAPPLQLDGNGP